MTPVRRALCGLTLLSACASAAPAQVGASADLRTLYERRLDQIRAKADPQAVAAALAALRPDGAFADLDYGDAQLNDAWQPKLHLDRLTTLSAAYVSTGPHRADPRVKAGVLAGIEWWLAHDYRSENWFWNEIGVPSRLAPSLLMFWDELSSEQKGKALAILGRAKLNNTGTNLVWLAMVNADRGLLTGDAGLVKRAFAKIADDIRLATEQKDGAQVDGSFLYHGALLYTWGYGSYYLHDQARLMALVAGTPFAFPDEKVVLIRDWTLDGAQWLARGPAADFGAEGREIARKHQDAKILNEIGKSLLEIDAGRTADVKAMLARTRQEAGAKPLVGNRAFWRADMMAHHRPGWYASARLYSARTRNTEWGNGEGLQSFYLADGATNLLRSGQEYYNVYPAWDWQRVPGTTVELLPNFGPVPGKPNPKAVGFAPNRDGISRKTDETFVGGASDGQYGVFGGRFSRDALSVRRGWFFFDDQYVCLGSGLSCTSDNPVVTTLDQCNSGGPVTVDPAAAERPRWLLHDGVGYAFLGDPLNVRHTRGTQTGSWHDVSIAHPPTPETRQVFKAWIEHGPQPRDASFAYAVYPQANAGQMPALADPARSPVRVAANTADCQAVWHGELNRGGAIFFAPGTLTFRPGLVLSVDTPCVVLLEMKDREAIVSISNPQNETASVRVTVRLEGRSATTTVRLPDGPRAGASVTERVPFK